MHLRYLSIGAQMYIQKMCGHTYLDTQHKCENGHTQRYVDIVLLLALLLLHVHLHKCLKTKQNS